MKIEIAGELVEIGDDGQGGDLITIVTKDRINMSTGLIAPGRQVRIPVTMDQAMAIGRAGLLFERVVLTINLEKSPVAAVGER